MLNDKLKLQWVDTLKTIGILAVILGHIASPFGQFIFSWHMPLFFVVSGFFIKFNLSFSDFFIKDFKRLMVPYFIFSFVGLGAEFLKRLLLHRDELDLLVEIKGILFYMDMSSLANQYGFVLWFLPALFFARLFLLLIQKITQNVFYNFIMVVLLFFISFYIDLPFALDNALNSVIWVYIGFVYFNYYQQNRWLYLLPVIGALVLLFFGLPELDMANKFYSNELLVILWALPVVYTFILTLKTFPILNTYNQLGKYTMLLFVFHPYTNNAAHIMVEKIHPNAWYLSFGISLLLLYMLILIKKKVGNKGFFKYV